MTLVTGHYAHRHGVTGNDPSPKYAKRGSKLYNERRGVLINKIDQFDTLPELLAERGYLSHQSGKWWEDVGRRINTIFSYLKKDRAAPVYEWAEELRVRFPCQRFG